ncbi:MAG TPA: membrane protein insertase YidC [Steroidobacteraceae bacterium]|nr:membrane protein insertase YidC [Steroidobacteraceae bacterium]
MSNNYSRISLWVILGFTLWLCYIQWNKDYAALDAARAAAASSTQASTTLVAQVPQAATQAASTPGATPAPGAATGTPAALGAAGATGTAAAGAPAGTPAAVTSASDPLAAAAGPAVHVRTDVLDLYISLQGGTIVQADLPKYPQVKGQPEPVRLENHASADSLYLLQTGLTGPAGSERPTQAATFTSAAAEYRLAAGQDTLSVPLQWSSGGVAVTKTFTFHRGRYLIEVSQQVRNDSAAAWPAAPYAQILRNDQPISSSFFNPNPERYAFHGPAIFDGSRYRKLKISSDDDRHLNIEVTGGWIAALQHHFVTAVVPAAGAPYRFTLGVAGNEFALAAGGAMASVPAGGTQTFDLGVFLGPKLQAQLSTAGPELVRVTDYGRLYFLAQPLFWALSKVHAVTGNWGVAILVVTFLLKLMLYPLSETSFRSMAKMRALQPRMKNLQELYKDDKEKLAKATMELYRKEKVNPVSGCLPQVVQIPLYIAFYWVLLESVEMRQAPFALWITDLSSRDPFFVLPILMAGAMFLQQRMSPASPDPTQQKAMMIMPFAMSALFAFLPAGLVLYYVTNTTLGLAQQWNMNRRLDAAKKT